MGGGGVILDPEGNDNPVGVWITRLSSAQAFKGEGETLSIYTPR